MFGKKRRVRVCRCSTECQSVNIPTRLAEVCDRSTILLNAGRRGQICDAKPERRPACIRLRTGLTGQLEVVRERDQHRSHLRMRWLHVWHDATGTKRRRAHGAYGCDDKLAAQRVGQCVSSAETVGNLE